MGKWAKRYLVGEESLEVNARSGHLVEVITEKKMALVKEMILCDRRLKVKEMAEIIQIPIPLLVESSMIIRIYKRLMQN